MPLAPAHACALLIDGSGHLLLEPRPAGAKHAAGRLTCFGGKVEAGERPISALRRELLEELGWAVRPVAGHVDLWRGEEWIARFFAMPVEAVEDLRLTRQGLVRVPPQHWQHPRISRWHRLVLCAWCGGRARVRI